MSKTYLVFLLIFFFASPLFAEEVDTAWVRRYNSFGMHQDRANDLAVDFSGNVYVTGGSGTIKYDADGNELWERSGSGSAVAIDRFGNVYVTEYFGGTRKYDSEGNQLWMGPWGGDNIGIDVSDNVYVNGQGGYGGYDYVTIKYLPNGDTSWVRRYKGPNFYDIDLALAIDGSKNVYVTGMSWGTEWSYSDYATIKYLPNGDTAWLRRYNGPSSDEDGAEAIAVDGSGNVYVTGSSIGNWLTDYDYLTIKYRPNGDTAWTRRYNGPVSSEDWAEAIAVDGSGNVYVTGTSSGDGTSSDYATIKYYPNGDTAWVRRYNGPGNFLGEACAIVVDGSGSVYVTGYNYDSLTSADYVTIKYFSNGDIAWLKSYNGSLNYEDRACAIALDRYKNVYVTGYSYDSMTGADYTTIKYIQASSEKPSEFTLSQNYPNPFNLATTINYSVERELSVKLTVYNILGQKVRTLVNQRSQKGSYSVQWDGANDKGEKISSGVYFYGLKVGGHSSSKKMILLK